PLDVEKALEGAGVAWFATGPTGRVIAASALFEAWTGARAGPTPSLAALLPDLADRLADDAAQAEGEVWSSRLIGTEAAPRAVTVSLTRAPNGAGLFGVAAPAPGPAAPALEPRAPLALGPAVGAEARRLLHAFDEMPAERVLAEAAIGALALSGEGRVLRLNAAADRLLTDRAAQAVAAEAVAGPVGDHFIDWVAEEDREQAEAGVAAAARGGVAAFEARLAGPSGAEGRLVQCYLSGIDSAAGRLLLCHLIDVSEGRGLEKNFIQAQKLQAVGQLAGGVAHDFNNLLTVIIGSADALLKRMTDTDPAYGDLNAIRQSGRRAAWLVGQLLAFSRKQTLTPKVANLTERCSEFVFLLARVIGEKYEIETDLEEGLWPVEVDVNQFEQVITNLVVNASHAMKGGGAIHVATANETIVEPRSQGNFTMPPGEYVRVTVRDSGSGIPREALAKIFEPFFTTKPVGQGTGLGLAVVYGVVKQSNGYVFVESEEGAGARFDIYLPRVSAERAAEAQASALKPASRRAREDRIAPPGSAPQALPGASQDAAAPRRGAVSLREAAARMGAEAGGARRARDRRDDPQPPAPRPVALGPQQAPRAGPGAILLVEDQAAVRAFAARSLTERGHRVLEAESGEEALEKLTDPALRIDLLLSDVVLEDTDGPSVLRRIGDARPEMRVIFMSGYARDAFAETLDSAAAHARETRFLQKPFTLDELAEAVEDALAHQSERLR
ncbi:MAG: ATP-binding protein, partial [Pseudomonadota bacterium]